MKKSAILILALGPILAAGCHSMNSGTSGPTPAPATQPTSVAAATPAAPVVPEKTTPVTPPPSVSPPAPAPVTPPPAPVTPPAAPWDVVVDGRPVFMTLVGEGVQIYECKKTDTGFEWELKGPESLLYNDKGRPVGKLTAGPTGPTWELSDGSKVVGEKIASAPNGGAVPLLLAKVVSASGKGKLTAVKYVKSVDTDGGGKPTLPADAAELGKTDNVAYKAKYLFYAGS